MNKRISLTEKMLNTLESQIEISNKLVENSSKNNENIEDIIINQKVMLIGFSLIAKQGRKLYELEHKQINTNSYFYLETEINLPREK